MFSNISIIFNGDFIKSKKFGDEIKRNDISKINQIVHPNCILSNIISSL